MKMNGIHGDTFKLIDINRQYVNSNVIYRQNDILRQWRIFID